MEISQIRDKTTSRGHWIIILEPLESNTSNIHPRDRYKILTEQSVRYRGWPFPYFPDINTSKLENEFVEISDDISGGIDHQHYKECFTLFKSGQFVTINGVSEDWVDESELLQFSPLKSYKQGEVLSFVSTTYLLSEMFLFIKNLISSELYKKNNNFMLKIYLQKNKGRSLKIFDPLRVEFSMDYKSSAENIAIYKEAFTKEHFIKNWKDILIECCIKFYKFFGTYDPNVKVIESDIDNLINRRY